MALPFEQLFTLAAFEGLRSVRHHLQQQPSLTLDEARIVVTRVERDAPTFDMDAACELHGVFPDDTPNDGPIFYRTCIDVLLVGGGHGWGRQITLGRTFFTRKLDQDRLSIFRIAGLLHDPPDDEVVDWWDRTARGQRLEAAIARDERSRAAEKLTMDHETKRLRAAGRNEAPVWMSVEDNTVGYDVRSHTITQFGVNNLQIEVKASIANPLEFHVTKNEWRVAQIFGVAYIFHIWDMRRNPPILHVRTVAEVEPHIPKNQADGEWADVIIPLGSN
jgi:hypothetical protein